jgi:ABC-type uncharacterized transport system permease subunit
MPLLSVACSLAPDDLPNAMPLPCSITCGCWPGPASSQPHACSAIQQPADFIVTGLQLAFNAAGLESCIGCTRKHTKLVFN